MRRVWPDFFDRALLAWEGLTLLAADLRHWAGPHLAAQAARTRVRPLTWSFAYVAGFCALSMAALDRPVAYWAKAHVRGEVEGFFKTVTHLGEAQFYLVPSGVATLVLLLLAWRVASPLAAMRMRRLATATAFLFLSMAASGLISNAVKTALGRLRPRYLFESGAYGFQPFNTEWGMNSFPSGHSQAAFAAMTAACVIWPAHRALWLTIAVLVAASRVATSVHYLSDAVFGSWLAIAVAIVFWRWFRAKGIDPRL